MFVSAMALGLFGGRPGSHRSARHDFLSNLHPDILENIVKCLDDRDAAAAACAHPRIPEFRRDRASPQLRNAVALFAVCRAAAGMDVGDVTDVLERFGLDADVRTFSAADLVGATNKRALDGTVVSYVWTGMVDPGTEVSTAYPSVAFADGTAPIALVLKKFEVQRGPRACAVVLWRSRTMVAILKFRSAGTIVSHVKQSGENVEEAARFMAILREMAPFARELRWKIVNDRSATDRTVAALRQRFEGYAVDPENTSVNSHSFLS